MAEITKGSATSGMDICAGQDTVRDIRPAQRNEPTKVQNFRRTVTLRRGAPLVVRPIDPPEVVLSRTA
ncbi:hypothetical protein AB0M79_27520 [Polymorphospora sp. NPDC051019]|uniref:hypothetical protein n=1 Tax=Polymorphospora sp. NPDC051019 TaxID=3155725 RepID=UPI00344A32E2